ncbi:hypothetical protein SR39_20605 [Methylobacterium radiotolerans]|uniref:GAP1-N1 domain-containing protein n=1 Tax=Methylobacterium organophilum TaxID=410 RepID=UPI0005BA9DE2|nr:hypothetical protein SR39_20605 [Methylobacterium radiotolerans]
MSAVERQVHGYQQGHQLLATSMPLPKAEQSVVNQLSDVAGPLRPRERFDPYLTAYPLPGGKRFVLARTWQDLTVARAGCVRTLSLVIPMDEWVRAEGLSAYFDQLRLDRLPDARDATQVVVWDTEIKPLPPAPPFNGSELLEALFLEDARPVVMLDALEPELVATRLLTALWPSLRRRFAVSTFARSPRKVGGRDFDLVFAPKDARSRFADWNGRRVDGRLVQDGRHRWTGAIVARVFDQPHPRLLTIPESGLVGGNDAGQDDAAALRIALLWDELVTKIHYTPTAALGLLDIVNSGKVRDSLAIKAIEPSLVEATNRASTTFADDDAWGFLGAISRKLQGRSMPAGRAAVADAVERLAERAPEGAVSLLSQDDPRKVLTELVPRIAAGLGSNFTDRAERALREAAPAVLGRLLAQGDALAGHVADDRPLVERLGQILPALDDETLDAVGPSLLPRLIDDWHLPAAEPLIRRLDVSRLASELRHLGQANDFAGAQLSGLVLDRALSAGTKEDVQSTLVTLPQTPRRDEMIARTLVPGAEDARWLYELDAKLLDRESATAMLLDLLGRADDWQFAAMLRDKRVGAHALSVMESKAPKLLLRAMSGDALTVKTFARVLPRVLKDLRGEARLKLAGHALHRFLRDRFDGDEIDLIASLLSAVGDGLDGAWFARMGLGRDLDGVTASRNMVALGRATQPARLRAAWAMEDIARTLVQRPSLDLDAAAVEACAALMLDAEKVAPRALLSASGHLLPVLLRSRDRPISPMIVAAFPSVHRELARYDDVPDLFKFIPFFDWDRCKAARHELVDAFMSSSWPPSDLALTACRTGEVSKILRRIGQQKNGKKYLKRLTHETAKLTDDCKFMISSELAEIDYHVKSESE